MLKCLPDMDLRPFLSPVRSNMCNKVDLLDASAMHSSSRWKEDELYHIVTVIISL